MRGATKQKGVRRDNLWVRVMVSDVCCCIIATLVVVAVWARLWSCGAGKQLDQCKSNLRNLATSLEMYSTDNSGRYPRRLEDLIPHYFRYLPACPAVGRDTYSASFTSSSYPDCYTVYCQGDNHHRAGCLPNYPQYNTSWSYDQM